MFAAARSFTDPPGLYHSALPKSATPGRSAVSASRRKSGVLPMRSTRLWPRVSPRPDATSRDPLCGAGADIAAILEDPSVIDEPKRHDQRNVLYSRKKDMY